MTSHTLEKYSTAVDVETLLDRCFGSIEFASRILEILNERCEPDIEAIEEAVLSEDYQQIYGIAHRLKGALANASADELMEIAEDLCTASKEMNPEASRASAGELRKRWDELSALMSSEN